jgi:uncharacterized protein (TIGR03437 family)
LFKRGAVLSILAAGILCGQRAPVPKAFSYPIRGSAHAVAIDPRGYIYVAGSTTDSGFQTTPGAYLKQSNAGSCYIGTHFGVSQYTPCPAVFVMKLDPTGSQVIFSTFIGGGDAEGLAVDADGNAYITGQAGNNFPTTAGPLQHGYTNGAFVTKLNADGNGLVYSIILPNSSGNAIALDATGKRVGRRRRGVRGTRRLGPEAAVVGYTSGQGFPVTPGAFQTSALNNVSTAFVLKLDSDGVALVYSTLLGGSGTQGDVALGLALDRSGNTFVTGQAGSLDFPVTQTPLQPLHTGTAAFIAKLDPTGSNLEYAALMGGSSRNAWGADIAVNREGHALVAVVSSSNSPVVHRSDVIFPDQTTTSVSEVSPFGDALLSSLTLNGVAARAIAIDGAGNRFITGQASALTTTDNALQHCPLGSFVGDSFVAEVSPDGAPPVFSTYLSKLLGQHNQLSDEGGFGITFDVNGNLLLAAGDVDVVEAPLAPAPAVMDQPCTVIPVWDYDGSGANSIAPGAIAYIQGRGLGPDQAVPYVLDETGRISTTLAGAQVFINGNPAPLLSVQATRIWFIVPFEVAGSQKASIQVVRSGNSSDPQSVSVHETSPAIQRVNLEPVTGPKAILNEDATLNSFSNSAKVGSVVTIYANGVGGMAPPQDDGSISTPPLSTPLEPITVWFGNVYNLGEVLSAQAAPGKPAGEVEIKVRIPPPPNPISGPPCVMIGLNVVGGFSDHSVGGVCLVN